MNRDDAITALISACLPSELDALGVLDCIGATDDRGVATALDCSPTYARSVLERLLAAGLVVLRWQDGRHRPWFGLAPDPHVIAGPPAPARSTRPDRGTT